MGSGPSGPRSPAPPACPIPGAPAALGFYSPGLVQGLQPHPLSATVPANRSSHPWDIGGPFPTDGPSRSLSADPSLTEALARPWNSRDSFIFVYSLNTPPLPPNRINFRPHRVHPQPRKSVSSQGLRTVSRAPLLAWCPAHRRHTSPQDRN